MVSLLRRRDEHDQLNNVSADVECGADNLNKANEDITGNASLEERGAKIWGPYLELADKFDKDLVHNWRDDMDSLLIFAALFSASVTAFVIESYKNLSQDPTEVTVSVLLQISQQLANGTHTPAAVLPPFRPGSTDVAVNVFWFLSLAFSLACALAAVLVRQWARQYLRFPRSFSSTTEQARARQYVYENVQWWKMELIVEMIPALLHISLILFFIGLLLFVRYINFTLAMYLFCFSTIGGAAYATLTIAPLIFRACPFKTPFSASIGLCTRFGAKLFREVRGHIVIFSGLLKGLANRIFSMSRRSIPNLRSPVSQNHQWAAEASSPHDMHGLGWGTPQASLWPPQFTTFSQPRIAQTPRRSLHTVYNSFRTSTTYSLKLFVRHLSNSLRQQRKMFHNELTTRDAHALRWTTEFSKRDADLLTIVQSIPDFVEISNRDAEVRAVMWKSGILTHIVRLLASCVTCGWDRNQVTNQPLATLCMQSLESITRCSISTLYEDDNCPGDLAAIEYLIEDIISTFRLPTLRCDEIGLFFSCVLSNLLLSLAYKLERQSEFMHFELYLQQFLTYSSTMSKAVKQFGWPIQVDFMARFIWEPPQSVENICSNLRSFREEWAAQFLSYIYEHRSGIGHGSKFLQIVLNSLCNGATHLPCSPQSTHESQIHMFGLMDDLYRRPSPPNELHTPLERLESAFLVYCAVLYGKGHGGALSYHTPTSRRELHTDFLGRVSIYKSLQLSWGDLSSSLPNGDADLEIDQLCDLSAEAIVKVIRCRNHWQKANDYDSGPIVVDARHLAAARAVMSWCVGMPELFVSGRGWAGLVYATARDLGYLQLLEGHYSVRPSESPLY